MGQTWSTPTFAKVKIGGEKHVAIIGGGYNNGQDNVGYHVDATGNAIYMIDVKSGDVVWSAGGDPNASHDLLMNSTRKFRRERDDAALDPGARQGD